MSNIQTGAERMPHDLSHLGFLAGQIGDRKSGSAGMPRPISYAVFCWKKKINSTGSQLAENRTVSGLSQQGLDLIFERVLSGGEVFRDRNLLRHDYMPATLPHREEQIRRLGSVLAPALTKDRVSNLFAHGKTGTVKTMLTKFVLDR